MEIDELLAKYQDEDWARRYDFDDPVVEAANTVVNTMEKLDLLLDGVEPEIANSLARWAG
jgi:hypothetical protein